MKSCPRCKRIYPDAEVFCEFDGTVLLKAEGIQPQDSSCQGAGAGVSECPVCGGQVSPQEPTCDFCGARLGGDAASMQHAPANLRSHADEPTQSISESLVRSLISPIGSLASLLVDRMGQPDCRSTDEGAPEIQDESFGAPRPHQLWLAADTAFSKLSPDVKIRFFSWLLPFARFDRVVDKRVLATIYSLFAVADLRAAERQQFAQILFQSEPLSEPQGRLELGGRFQRLYLLLNALEIVGSDPSEKALRLITRLATEERLSHEGFISWLNNRLTAENIEEVCKAVEIGGVFVHPAAPLFGGLGKAIAHQFVNEDKPNQGDQGQDPAAMDLAALRVYVLSLLRGHEYSQVGLRSEKDNNDRMRALSDRYRAFLKQDAEALNAKLPSCPEQKEICETARRFLLDLLQAESVAGPTSE